MMYKIHIYIFETYFFLSWFDSPPKTKSNFIILLALATDGQIYIPSKTVDYSMLTQTIVFLQFTTTTKTFLNVTL